MHNYSLITKGNGTDAANAVAAALPGAVIDNIHTVRDASVTSVRVKSENDLTDELGAWFNNRAYKGSEGFKPGALLHFRKTRR